MKLVASGSPCSSCIKAWHLQPAKTLERLPPSIDATDGRFSFHSPRSSLISRLMTASIAPISLLRDSPCTQLET